MCVWWVSEGHLRALLAALSRPACQESILRRFDVTVISRYFLEFEQELPHYL